MADTALVTDGSDSFFGSRAIFQCLHDYGDFARIVAYSSSTSDAKKMCISRQARYSGLIDVLDFKEGEATGAGLTDALVGVTTWVAVNADESSVLAQATAAQQAGVKRAFIHLSASGPSTLDEAALSSALASSGMAYTVMRTGGLAKSGGGGGLIIGELGLPACDEVPLDDAFRFLVESLTIPEAESRVFSLCPSADVSQLKEMRVAGCTRREEAVALLQGLIKERTEEERASAAATANEKKATVEGAEADGRSEEEIAAAQEEEVKALLAKAKREGVENAKKRAEDERVKAEKRKERLQYFKDNEPKDRGDDDDGDDDSTPPPETNDGGGGGLGPTDSGGEGGGGGVALAERPEGDEKEGDDATA